LTKERRFLRPDHAAASLWVDIPTTVKEENPKLPRTVWFATPMMHMLLKDSKEMDVVVDGAVRTVYPRFHAETFNKRMEAANAGIPENQADGSSNERMDALVASCQYSRA
jgi:hypothetical protein